MKYMIATSARGAANQRKMVTALLEWLNDSSRGSEKTLNVTACGMDRQSQVPREGHLQDGIRPTVKCAKAQPLFSKQLMPVFLPADPFSWSPQQVVASQRPQWLFSTSVIDTF